MFAKKKPGVVYPPYVTAPQEPGEPRPVGQPPRTTRSKAAPEGPVRRVGFRARKNTA
ncbi:hypothetical protein [Streptomyces tsukubensis]|uniref:hypothetical protein n=1 Tax=Streptomyces tsukubensis TaxID=83656 RepID=UPI00344F8F74